jgi:integrase
LGPDPRYIYGTSVAQAVFIRHRKERGVYQLRWFEQGRERTRSYPSRQEAEQEKQRRLDLLSQGNAPEPFDLLPPHEKRELFAIHERAREKGYELWDVARLHERQLEQQRVPGIEIGNAVKRCLEDKEAEGVSPRSLQSLRSVLLRFASRHEGKLMDELDAADATTFVDTLGVSLRTRLGYLTDLRTIFSWGVQKGHIEVNPVVAAMPGRATRKRIMLAKRSRRKEQVLSVEECEKLIRWVEMNDPGLLVYPVLCLLAGLRPELEATGIDWADVMLEHITVDASIAKDAETRIIEPLTPNLVEWIRAIRDSSKSPLPLRNLRRRWERAREVLGRDWPHDAMRHSYASYHFAMYRDAGLTAKNLGHPSPTLLRKDYNNAVTRAEAERFWSIAPGGVGGGKGLYAV